MTQLTKTRNGVEVPLSEEEIEDFNRREQEHIQKMAAYEPVKYKDERQALYAERGITESAMIVSLWERIVENRPESSDALQLARLGVKQQIPKPT